MIEPWRMYERDLRTSRCRSYCLSYLVFLWVGDVRGRYKKTWSLRAPLGEKSDNLRALVEIPSRDCLTGTDERCGGIIRDEKNVACGEIFVLINRVGPALRCNQFLA